MLAIAAALWLRIEPTQKLIPESHIEAEQKSAKFAMG